MKKRTEEKERRCVLTGLSKPRAELIRLVLGPDGSIVPDLAEKLPGRGVWIEADRTVLEKTLSAGKLVGLIARSLKTSVKKDAAGDDFAERLDTLLAKRCLSRLSLEQRAGNIVTGFDKIKAEFKGKNPRLPLVLMAASDGGRDGRQKIQATVGHDTFSCSLFSREALSKALGKDNIVHAIVFSSGGAKILKAEIGRLKRYRGEADVTATTQRNEE